MKKPAFTLAELLVALLIIAVILTLLAPVLTKRGKQALTIGKKNYQYKLYTYDKTNPECEEIAGVDNSLKCNFTVPAQVSLINAIAVSGGGGGAGATQSSVEYSKLLTVASLNQTTDKKQEIPIGPDITNITVKHLSGSGAGGGGASWTSAGGSGGAPTSQADCDPFNALFIPAKYNGTGGKNLCVTKYNVGDTNGPTIASGIKVITTGTSDTCLASSTNCCWNGNTSNSGSCTTSGNWGEYSSTYSGCQRTVCQWAAANSSCLSWTPQGTSAGSWRLPTESELRGWGTIINSETSGNAKISKYLGSSGLQLCDFMKSSSGSIFCFNGPCQGANINVCYPYNIWSSTTYNVNNRMYLELSGGKTRVINYDQRRAFSARCVLESGLSSNTALSGGGGGAGAYIKNYQIPSNIITSNIGGKIVLYAAAGGSGGTKITY